MNIQHISERRVYNLLFFFFAFLSVLPVWWFPGFLTADGPCHVYNAAVLKDFFTEDTSFYSQFYTVNVAPEPNWFSHFTLALLMFVFNPQVAEKILISLCVLNMAFGFRYFITSIKQGNDYLYVCIFPFLWQMAMFMGFYNYMLSIGCMFWVTGYWLNNHSRITPRQMFWLCGACIIVYFMHLLGIFLSGAIMGLITLVSFRKENRAITWKEIRNLVLVMLPVIALSLNYIVYNSGSFSDEYKQPFHALWYNLRDIFSMQSIHPDEYKLTIIMAQVIAAYFAYALIQSVFRSGAAKLWIMPLVMLAILALCYFFAYESMLGGSYIRYRLECLIYIFALITVGTAIIPSYLRHLLGLFFITATLIYFGMRWGAFKDIDIMVSEIRSLRPYIKDKSVVLPLKYASFPTDYRGEKVMAAKVLLFSHVGEVMYSKGTHLIFCENYEANTGYFPLLWKEQVNPFLHLGRGPGIEGTPPDADIKGYNDKNHRIDNIVIWGRQGDILKDSLTQSLADNINKYYKLVYVTPLYKIELYSLKDI